MSTGVEQGLRVRAAVCDMKLKLQRGDWETSSAENMAHVWITDCDSLYEHLISTRAKQVDNQRLGIDMAALRQIVWDRREGLDTTMADTTKGDYVPLSRIVLDEGGWEDEEAVLGAKKLAAPAKPRSKKQVEEETKFKELVTEVYGTHAAHYAEAPSRERER